MKEWTVSQRHPAKANTGQQRPTKANAGRVAAAAGRARDATRLEPQVCLYILFLLITDKILPPPGSIGATKQDSEGQRRPA